MSCKHPLHTSINAIGGNGQIETFLVLLLLAAERACVPTVTYQGHSPTPPPGTVSCQAWLWHALIGAITAQGHSSCMHAYLFSRAPCLPVHGPPQASPATRAFASFQAGQLCWEGACPSNQGEML
eukprot:1156705-Pelagomonas_calceolata.AAC.1